jgi:uncharacterized protein YndB with AHSA1/START domain
MWAILSTTRWLSNDNSNQLVVKEAAMEETVEVPTERRDVRREVEIDASPEEVYEALITEEGRERWLQEPEREIHIESAEPPNRLVWWWAGEEQPATRVAFQIVALPRGTRVVVTESSPTFPLAAMAASLTLVAA